jgi:hypothetical protein
MVKSNHALFAYGFHIFKKYTYKQRGLKIRAVSVALLIFGIISRTTKFPIPHQFFKSRSDRLPCQIKVPIKGTPLMPCVAKY